MPGCIEDTGQPLPLRQVADIRLPGTASRFDYQDIDPEARRLYLAHLGASQVQVIDIDRLEPSGSVSGIRDVHGVTVAPDLGRVFATATGTDQLVAIDTKTLGVIYRVPTGRFPDGVAYDPVHRLVAVSNKDDGSETIVDASTGRLEATITIGREVGNVLFDPDQQTLVVAVTPPDALALVDPTTGSVTRRIPLSGCHGAHGLAEDRSQRLAFVACEDNARLAVVDLGQGRQQAILSVGGSPDVLAYDAGLGRLYVASESGVVAVFDTTGSGVHKLAQAHLAAHAHSVSVDPRTHQVLFPLERVRGHPVLRVLRP